MELKGNYPRIIPVKFGEILPSTLGGDVVLSKLLLDGRTTEIRVHGWREPKLKYGLGG